MNLPKLQDLVDFVPLLGWSTIVSFFIWAWRKSISVSLAFSRQQEEGKKAMSQINEMATNHFPHMQSDLASLNTKTDKGNEILSNIDKGIAVLVDRERE